MGLRTRKWGCAFGITLLLAASIVGTVLLGQPLARSKSAEDMLRIVPLFPNASHATYASLEEPSRRGWQGDTAQIVYRVSEPPETVIAYYTDNLTQDGWDTVEDGRYTSLFATWDVFISGVSLTSQAPWIKLEQNGNRKAASVTAYRVEIDGEEFTEVTVELILGAHQLFIK